MLVRIDEQTIEEELVWTVNFPYDAKLKDLLKESVYQPDRMWNPGRKIWVVLRNATTAADLKDFIEQAEKLGHKVVDRRTKESFNFSKGRRKTAPPPPPPPPPRGKDTWADTLFRAVGKDREEAVFKALTKVLHPDVKTGSVELMQQLNVARDKRR